LTIAYDPTKTVGTDSLPPVTDRTRAAAYGSSQMLISRTGSPLRRNGPRDAAQ
jgi:hypothetical protein